jgi:hypothetical protein
MVERRENGLVTVGRGDSGVRSGPVVAIVRVCTFKLYRLYQ